MKGRHCAGDRWHVHRGEEDRCFLMDSHRSWCQTLAVMSFTTLVDAVWDIQMGLLEMQNRFLVPEVKTLKHQNSARHIWTHICVSHDNTPANLHNVPFKSKHCRHHRSGGLNPVQTDPTQSLVPPHSTHVLSPLSTLTFVLMRSLPSTFCDRWLTLD